MSVRAYHEFRFLFVIQPIGTFDEYHLPTRLDMGRSYP